MRNKLVVPKHGPDLCVSKDMERYIDSFELNSPSKIRKIKNNDLYGYKLSKVAAPMNEKELVDKMYVDNLLSDKLKLFSTQRDYLTVSISKIDYQFEKTFVVNTVVQGGSVGNAIQ